MGGQRASMEEDAAAATQTDVAAAHPPPPAAAGTAPAAPAGVPELTPANGPNPRGPGAMKAGGPCNHCGRTESPLWRKGPDDKPVLCNACGARWLVKRNLEGYSPGAPLTAVKSSRARSSGGERKHKKAASMSSFGSGEVARLNDGGTSFLGADGSASGKRQRRPNARYVSQQPQTRSGDAEMDYVPPKKARSEPDLQSLHLLQPYTVSGRSGLSGFPMATFAPAGQIQMVDGTAYPQLVPYHVRAVQMQRGGRLTHDPAYGLVQLPDDTQLAGLLPPLELDAETTSMAICSDGSIAQQPQTNDWVPSTFGQPMQPQPNGAGAHQPFPAATGADARASERYERLVQMRDANNWATAAMVDGRGQELGTMGMETAVRAADGSLAVPNVNAVPLEHHVEQVFLPTTSAAPQSVFLQQVPQTFVDPNGQPQPMGTASPSCGYVGLDDPLLIDSLNPEPLFLNSFDGDKPPQA